MNGALWRPCNLVALIMTRVFRMACFTLWALEPTAAGSCVSTQRQVHGARSRLHRFPGKLAYPSWWLDASTRREVLVEFLAWSAAVDSTYSSIAMNVPAADLPLNRNVSGRLLYYKTSVYLRALPAACTDAGVPVIVVVAERQKRIQN